jgi:enolase-phosphatase E1
MPIRAILTDIEGTTSSIQFVHQVLFPYSSKEMATFLTDNQDAPAVQRALDEVAMISNIARNDLPTLTEQLLSWIKADNKIGVLKTLQGMLWKQGYQDGAYRGHVYPEVAHCLASWHAAGKLLYVYSSGSVAAQKLLFRYSDAGDLTPMFNGYFDTNVGAKREFGSYQNIARSIGLVASEILFLSDIVEELDAARTAGMRTCQLRREGNACVQTRHPVATDFDQVGSLL